ncbi:hypothetical protein GGI25_005606 [Coemansia spiralis]|uniref:Queuosine 5'-phosphate N-glycosylase/hydrolase n=2 Tax=Coemansia TaxID=4863 RepID=A0A9W8KVZ5_9FUNG|nr:hypothetical protein EDC05_004657 [Coemansia umbellata]KAJ2620170.1 hypothetical protein GGI26_005235 [Coemansia sp. RSA 1358]KAJ2671120.1 hypothetical protein GGI25_005606 [Coemansia spiralis]
MNIISEVSGDPGAELPTAWINACTGNSVPLPHPSENYFGSVRETTAKFINSSTGQSLVSVDADNAKRYVQNILNPEKFAKYVKKIDGWTRSLPLVFDNVAQEINLIAIIDLLQVGSGFRRELHKEIGRGASDTINFGCMSLHISQTPIDARGLQALTLGDISQHFGVPLFGEERPMVKGNSAVMVSEAGSLRPFAEIILGILQDTGRRLEQGGYSSFADYIIKVCSEKATAAHLVAALANGFPSLHDAARIDGSPVYLFKKAQLIAYDICKRLGNTDTKFAFPDIADMTVFADNVVPAMLQHHGLIIPCKTISDKIKNGKELSFSETTAMRAASVVAAQLVVDYANDPGTGYSLGDTLVNQATLDGFWWLEGKDPELRAVPRFICKSTVYF